MDEVNQMLAKLKDVPVIIETNAAGKVMKMVNREQIEEKMNVIIKEFVDNIFKMTPEMAQAMKKEDIEKAMHAKLTEKEILDEFTENIFDLYDKPIANNYEEIKDVDGLRLKLTYTVANIFGYLFTLHATVNDIISHAFPPKSLHLVYLGTVANFPPPTEFFRGFFPSLLYPPVLP